MANLIYTYTCSKSRASSGVYWPKFSKSLGHNTLYFISVGINILMFLPKWHKESAKSAKSAPFSAFFQKIPLICEIYGLAIRGWFFCAFVPLVVSLSNYFVAILSKKKRLFPGFTNADNVSNLDKLRKPNAQARLEYGCEFV